MIDTILWCIGAAVSILMGMGVSAYLVYWTAKAWIKASMAWRGIFQAETLIYEYKRDYDLFQQWRHKRLEEKRNEKTEAD